MRLVTFDSGGADHVGVRLGDEVVDLAIAAPELPSSIVRFLEAGDDALTAAKFAADQAGAGARAAIDTLKFRPVLPRPPKIICLGLNYAEHAAEGGHALPAYPSFFMRGATSLVGHEQPIIRPQASEQLDYEAELVAIVGKRCRHVSEVDALSVIAGYSIFNEGSVRYFQRKTSQWTIGKNFDATGGFGPDFVTADELPPGAVGLRIATHLNGRTMQDDNTANMLFGVAETISIVTECLTLEPGDVIVTGTPSGVGHARKPPVWMKDGDICEIEIESIGTLRNPVVDEA